MLHSLRHWESVKFTMNRNKLLFQDILEELRLCMGWGQLVYSMRLNPGPPEYETCVISYSRTVLSIHIRFTGYLTHTFHVNRKQFMLLGIQAPINKTGREMFLCHLQHTTHTSMLCSILSHFRTPTLQDFGICFLSSTLQNWESYWVSIHVTSCSVHC
jgi:hypothetical protein